MQLSGHSMPSLRRGGEERRPSLGSAASGWGKRPGPRPGERTHRAGGSVTHLALRSAAGVARGFPFSLPLAGGRASLLVSMSPCCVFFLAFPALYTPEELWAPWPSA